MKYGVRLCSAVVFLVTACGSEPEACRGSECRAVPALEGGTELSLLAALDDREFLLERTGTGVPQPAFLARFNEVWSTVDDWYGAFDSAPVDWDETYERYVTEAKDAPSRYEQVDLLYRMTAELEDTHTGFYDLAMCEEFGAQYPPTSFSFYLAEVEGDLYVYASDDPRVRVGMRVVSVNGMTVSELERYWRTRYKCLPGFSSESIERTAFLASVLALVADPLFLDTAYEELLGVALEDEVGTVELTARDASAGYQRWQPDLNAYYGTTPTVALDWLTYDTGIWGGGQTGYIGHGRTGGTAVMVLYNFLGEEDFERALREVVRMYPDATGSIIDIRYNGGGGPHQETLASFFTSKTLQAAIRETRRVGGPRLAWDPCAECITEVEPDSDLRVGVPVAVLTDGFSTSAADHFAYLMTQVPTARLFGHPTSGAFGNISQHEGTDGSYALSVTWSRQSSHEGEPLQGVSVVPDTETPWSLEHIHNDQDPALRAALDWLEGLAVPYDPK